jgi:hypothetical protein
MSHTETTEAVEIVFDAIQSVLFQEEGWQADEMKDVIRTALTTIRKETLEERDKQWREHLATCPIEIKGTWAKPEAHIPSLTSTKEIV